MIVFIGVERPFPEQRLRRLADAYREEQRVWDDTAGVVNPVGRREYDA
jgi:hypothetical protein